MATLPKTDFKKGDNVTVLNYHTSIAPMAWPTPCYIVDIEDDYYLMRKRSFTDSRIFRVGMYYPHVKKD